VSGMGGGRRQPDTSLLGDNQSQGNAISDTFGA
jgi:hypothetical protein